MRGLYAARSAVLSRIHEAFRAPSHSLEIFKELERIYRTMVFVGGVVGLRVSEVIGPRRSDCDFESGEIHLSRGIVRQHEMEMKTKASRKPVPMEQRLAEVLTSCRAS